MPKRVEKPLTHEERRRLIEKPLPGITVYSGHSWSGTPRWADSNLKARQRRTGNDFDYFGDVDEED